MPAILHHRHPGAEHSLLDELEPSTGSGETGHHLIQVQLWICRGSHRKPFVLGHSYRHKMARRDGRPDVVTTQRDCRDPERGAVTFEANSQLEEHHMTIDLDPPTVKVDPLAPAKLGPITLRNRVIKAATFEGLTPKGLVTDELIEFHRRPAAGGVGMTTVAYCAVAPTGARTRRARSSGRDEAMPGLRQLTDAIHAEGAAASAQIGHAGPVANAKSSGIPGAGPVPGVLAMTTRNFSSRRRRKTSPGSPRRTGRRLAGAVEAGSTRWRSISATTTWSAPF